jgi:hypothetical protein
VVLEYREVFVLLGGRCVCVAARTCNRVLALATEASWRALAQSTWRIWVPKGIARCVRVCVSATSFVWSRNNDTLGGGRRMHRETGVADNGVLDAGVRMISGNGGVWGVCVIISHEWMERWSLKVRC